MCYWYSMSRSRKCRRLIIGKGGDSVADAPSLASGFANCKISSLVCGIQRLRAQVECGFWRFRLFSGLGACGKIFHFVCTTIRLSPCASPLRDFLNFYGLCVRGRCGKAFGKVGLLRSSNEERLVECGLNPILLARPCGFSCVVSSVREGRKFEVAVTICIPANFFAQTDASFVRMRPNPCCGRSSCPTKPNSARKGDCEPQL